MQHRSMFVLLALLFVALLAVPVAAQEEEAPTPEETAVVELPDDGVIVVTPADEVIEAARNEVSAFAVTVAGAALLAVVFISVAAIFAVWKSAPPWAIEASKPLLRDVALPALNGLLLLLRENAARTTSTVDDKLLEEISLMIDAKIAELGLLTPESDAPFPPEVAQG